MTKHEKDLKEPDGWGHQVLKITRVKAGTMAVCQLSEIAVSEWMRLRHPNWVVP